MTTNEQLSSIIKIPVTVENLNDWDVEITDIPPSSNNIKLTSTLPLANAKIDIPFAYYPKSERLGRVADWTGPTMESSASGTLVSNMANGAGRRTTFTRFTRPEDEDAGWSLAAASSTNSNAMNTVANSGMISAGASAPSGSGMMTSRSHHQKMPSKTGRPRFNQNYNQQGQGYGYGHGGGRRHLGWGGRGGFGDRGAMRKREPSITVAEEWRLVEDIEFGRLSRLQLNPPEAIGLATKGTATLWADKLADRLSSKSSAVKEMTLTIEPKDTKKAEMNTDIPLIGDAQAMDLAKKHGARILCTAEAAVALMTAPISVAPWDIIVTKRYDPATPSQSSEAQNSTLLLIIDCRPESTVGNVTVQENTSESLSEETLATLSTLATRLRQQIPCHLSRNAIDITTEGPHLEIPVASVDGSTAAAADDDEKRGNATFNVYSIVDLGDDNVMLVKSRLNTIAASTTVNQKCWQPLLVTPLLEHTESSTTMTSSSTTAKGASGVTPSFDWRSKLESQPGALLAQIIRNNGAQLARSIYSTLLLPTSPDQESNENNSTNGLEGKMVVSSPGVKLAYCTRVNQPRNKVALLAVQSYDPEELASQMSLNIPNGFGILRAIIELFWSSSIASGDYVLMRDPNKPLLRLYCTKTHGLRANTNGDGEDGQSGDVEESVINELIPSLNRRHLGLEGILADDKEDDEDDDELLEGDIESEA